MTRRLARKKKKSIIESFAFVNVRACVTRTTLQILKSIQNNALTGNHKKMRAWNFQAAPI